MKKFVTAVVLALSLLALPAKANKSPWTETIGENYQLTECQETARRAQIAMKTHDMLIQAMNSKVKDEGVKQVMTVEIRALYEYVGELQTWMSDNCSES